MRIRVAAKFLVAAVQASACILFSVAAANAERRALDGVVAIV